MALHVVLGRQWERVLQQRVAHSLGTWEEDEVMPYNPAVIHGGLEGSMVSQVCVCMILATYMIGIRYVLD